MMLSKPRLLPVPAGMQVILDAKPRAFYAGCAAARDAIEHDENPYTRPAEHRAWASGWLSVREGWVESMDHGVRT